MHCATTKFQFLSLGFDRDLGFLQGSLNNNPPKSDPSQKKPSHIMDPPPKKHTVHQKIQISQLWNLIETWGFCEDLKPVVLPVSDIPSDPPKHPSHILYPTSPKSTMCNNKSSNFSALELDRNLGFSRRPSHIGGPVAATEHSFLFN